MAFRLLLRCVWANAILKHSPGLATMGNISNNARHAIEVLPSFERIQRMDLQKSYRKPMFYLNKYRGFLWVLH